MNDKITISGIELDNCPVRESLFLLDEELERQPLFVIEEITAKMMLLAQTDKGLRESIEGASHTIFGEPGVLEAAGAADPQRTREIEGQDFFYGLMAKLIRGRKKLFLLGQGVRETEQFFQYLQDEFSRCELIGAAALEENVGSDAVVNEINAAAADVVMCIIPTPERASFLLQYKGKISASLWYGMEPDKHLTGRRGLLRWIRRHLHRRRLAGQVESAVSADGRYSRTRRIPADEAWL